MNCLPMFLSASPKDFVCMKEKRETIPREKEEATQKENAHICLLLAFPKSYAL